MQKFGLAEPQVLPNGLPGDRQPFFRAFLEGNAEEGDTAVFASPYMVGLLQQATEIHLDGTLKVVPKHPSIQQLLTIHVTVGSNTFPAVYALMTRRTKAAYARLLEYVKLELAVNMAPRLIMTDFEVALQNALEEALPNAAIHGCYFHFGQAIWRKCQKIGLAPYYNLPTSDARKFVKKIIALALLAADKIVEAVGILEATINEMGPADIREKLRQLVGYIRRFWLTVIGVDRLCVRPGAPHE